MYLLFEILATILMGFNVLHTIHMFVTLKRKHGENKVFTRELKIIGNIYISLLVGFFAGYIAIMICSRRAIGEMVVAQLIFWGAVFVMVSIYVLNKLYSIMDQLLVSGLSDLKLSLDTYINGIPGGVHHCVLEPEPMVTFVNNGFTDITGFTIDDINSMYNGKYTGIIYQDDIDVFVKGLQYLISTESSMNISYRIVNKRGEIMWLADSLNFIRDSKGTAHLLAVVTDITNEKNNAKTDSLTGLLNKGAFNTKVNEYMSLNPQKNMGLFMIDLNFFKEVNDRFGHQNGDIILVETAKYLKNLFSEETDVVGRVGGDEFMIMVENPQSEQYLLEKKQYLDSDFKLCIAELEDFPVVTASVGYTFAKCQESFDVIFRRADFAMYEEKKLKHKARK